jgi:serine phosphatase RsbU (regulator of sigma subunit)
VQSRQIDERSREELEQALLRERQARARLERLRLVQQRLSGSLDPDEVRAALLAVAKDVDGASSAMLVSEHRGAFAFRSVDGGPETAGVLGEGSPVLRAVVAARAARAELALAAGDDGRRLVVLDLGGDEAGREALVLDGLHDPVGGHDLAVLEILAREARQALENARLYQREHRIAETLQRSVMPESLMEVDGLRFSARYLPGSSEADIGGDWYDVFRGAEGSVHAVVGDVGGKGVIAAAQMGQLRSVVRAIGMSTRAPAELLSSVDRYLHDQDVLYATLAVVTIEPGTTTCCFALAGHPPPLVVDASGDARFLEGGRNLPLGAEIELPTVEARIHLVPGDTLLLYTDGLVERRSRPLDEGLDRLRCEASAARASAVPFLDGLLLRLVDDARRSDDIALLAVTVDEVPLRPSGSLHEPGAAAGELLADP